MLGKLLKHEFRATSRIMLPLYLVLMIMAVFGNVAVRIMDHSNNDFLNLLAGLTMTAFVFLMVAVALMSVYLMVSRFHKNLLTDEGYLMFTLPTSVHSLIFSKIIVSTVWFIGTMVMAGVAMVILFFELQNIPYFFSGIKEIFDRMTTYYALNGAAMCLELLVLMVLACAAFCLLVYAAAAVGHSFANHKIALSFAFFILFNWATQFVGLGTILLTDGWNLTFAFMDNWSPMAMTHFLFALGIVAELVFCAIFYIITAITLQKRINLE